ncbi:MAG: hypothetical protein J6E46_09510 [Faecalicoccus sp.]|nr:hypothetical protein [Faecalicoccus sp.]
MHKKIIGMACALSMLLSGCSGFGPNVDNVSPTTFVEGLNSFNWNLLAELHIKANQFYSAYGISEALIIAANGADGQTLEELMNLYGMDDIQQLNEEALALTYAVSNDGFVNANSIWIDEGLTKSDQYDDYENTVRNYHHATVRTVDFAGNTNQVKQDINRWVKKQTQGFISNYQSHVSESTVTNIINAVYFKGMWEFPFDESDTHFQNFHGLNGNRDVSMMHIFSVDVPYYETDSLKAVTLNYEDHDKSVTFITTKDEAINVVDVWNDLPNDKKNEFLKNLDDSDASELGTIAIPSLEMDITMNGLKKALTELGAGTMFTSDADFSKIADHLFVSSIEHRAKVRMNEEGTEAAAVTEIGFDTTMAPFDEDEKLEFIADHPYIFVIRDTDTGVILFTGVVQDVEQ